MKPKPFVYKVKKLVKVVDGDTVDVLLDLGFHTYVKKRVRLHGIDAWESTTRNKEVKKLGLAAKARLKELCGDGEGLVVECTGIGKYGRVIGILFNLDQGNVNLNKMLVLEGHAKEYGGRRR